MTPAGALALAALAYMAGTLIGVLRRDRLAQANADLTAQLDAARAALRTERAMVGRLSGGADDILAAVRAAHHTEEADRGR